MRIPVPERGDFLGVIANYRSKSLMKAFHRITNEHVPELNIVSYKVPLSGYIIPQTRWSDHASFWNRGYPALMLTDTAMFRNPYYHTPYDKYENLDFTFVTNVTKAVVSVILNLDTQTD